MVNRYLRCVNSGAAIVRAFVATSSVMLLMCGAAAAESKFESASIYLERNATDDDVEVRIAATSNEKGLVALRVIAPDGRIVVDFKAPDSKLGIRHVDLETPEPPLNDGRVQADFPQGVYRFEGTLIDSELLLSEATLSHALPDAPTVTSPPETQKYVQMKGSKVRWMAVKDAGSYVLVIQGEDNQQELKVTLPGNTTSFNIPDGFLVGASDYKLEIGAVLKSGNRTFVEREFTATK